MIQYRVGVFWVSSQIPGESESVIQPQSGDSM